MKRAALLLLLLGHAAALTPEQTAQKYGQDVLKAYAAQGLKVTPGKMFDLDCNILLKMPHDIKQCTLHIWGKQATAEILYELAGNPMNNWRQLWVGQMRGLPSDAQAQALVKALAVEDSQWVGSPAGKAWFAQQNKKRPTVMYGYRLDCAVFTKHPLPAGIKSCYEGPGPADGPTITLQLADGRSFSAGVR